MILLTFRALRRTWPSLLAWFLAGWAVRLMLLRFAGWAAENIDPLVGQLILPLAVLARLSSYVGMFLVLRPALSSYDRLEGLADRATPGPTPSFFTAWANTVGAAIVPFFVIYAAWGLIREDSVAYSSAAVEQLNLDNTPGTTPLDTPFTLPTISIVVGAFVLRRLIARFSPKLPRWFGIVAVYLEAVWVFIAVSFIRDLLAGVPDWFATRRMFAWAVDGWAQLRETLPAVQFVSDGWNWITRQLGEAVFQPLAWLALAAIVLAGALPLVSRRRRKNRITELGDSASRRWRAIGPRTRRILMWPVNGFLERWQPIATALRLIWGAGPVVMGLYVIAFGVLTIGTEWMRYGLYHALGPHSLGWWRAWDQPIGLLVDTVIFLLQICLVAAAFDRCIRALDERVSDPAEELAQVESSTA
ncbi:MAG: hypothetical protein ABIQ01_01725 [Pseudolysinimonas sp.]